MKISSVEPSTTKETASLQFSRDDARSESFESSLMSVLDSGEEVPRESSHEERDPQEEATSGSNAEQADDTPDAVEQSVGAHDDNEQTPETHGQMAPPPEDVEIVEELVNTLPTEATSVPTQVEPIATQIQPEPTAPQVEVERAEGPRIVDPRIEVAEGRKIVETPVPVEARTSEGRPAGTAPQSITDAAQLASSPATSGENRQSEQRSRGEGEERQVPWRESAAGSANEASGAGVREAATDQVAANVGEAREIVAAGEVAGVRADPSIITAAAQTGVVAVEPVVEMSEPAAPASPTRPMPPEAIPQHVEWLVARGGGSAQIELHPPELGKVSIQVSVRGGDVQVVMNVQSASTQTVVAEYRDTLESGLNAKDLKLDQFEVRDWGSRDDHANRDQQTERERVSAGRSAKNGRGEEVSVPHGVAAALMNPNPNAVPMASDDGVNLRV